MIIYLAVNRVNGKKYVGKTRRSFEVRLREHRYDARNKTKMAISQAIAKYGFEAFEFSILEECTLENIDARERYWIALHDCRKPNGYNITEGGNGGSGVKRPDTAERNRAKLGDKNPSFGIRYSPEQRKRFGQPGKRNARYGIRLTPEFKALISERTKAAMQRPEVRERFLAGIRKAS